MIYWWILQKLRAVEKKERDLKPLQVRIDLVRDPDRETVKKVKKKKRVGGLNRRKPKERDLNLKVGRGRIKALISLGFEPRSS